MSGHLLFPSLTACIWLHTAQNWNICVSNATLLINYHHRGYFIQDSQIIFAKCSVCSFLTELFVTFANIWYLLCGLFAISSSSTLWTRSEIPTENKWTAFFSRSSAALSLVNSTPRVLYPSVKNTATRFTPKQIKQLIISNYICVVCFLHFFRLYSIRSKKRQQSKINLARNSLKIRENREKERT